MGFLVWAPWFCFPEPHWGTRGSQGLSAHRCLEALQPIIYPTWRPPATPLSPLGRVSSNSASCNSFPLSLCSFQTYAHLSTFSRTGSPSALISHLASSPPLRCAPRSPQGHLLLQVSTPPAFILPYGPTQHLVRLSQSFS